MNQSCGNITLAKLDGGRFVFRQSDASAPTEYMPVQRPLIRGVPLSSLAADALAPKSAGVVLSNRPPQEKIMLLVIEEYPAASDSHLGGPVECCICNGLFFIRGIERVLMERDELNQEEPLGSVCPNCSQESIEYLRELFQKQAAKSHLKARIARHRYETLEYALTGTEHAYLDISSEVEILRCDEIGYDSDGDIWDNYAKEATVERHSYIPNQVSAHKGFVYLIGSPEGYCKIGRTKALHPRLASISLQLPFKVELLHSIEVTDCVKAERYLHRRFAQCRLNGEWFLLSVDDITWFKSQTRLETD